MTDDSEIAASAADRKEPDTSQRDRSGVTPPGAMSFRETQLQIEHLNAQIAQSELIVAASESGKLKPVTHNETARLPPFMF
jgi:hypothetical protein